MPFETRAVLAGAYKGRAIGMLTHAVETSGSFDLSVLCGRVKLEHMADVHALNPLSEPTCYRCATRLYNATGFFRPQVQEESASV